MTDWNSLTRSMRLLHEALETALAHPTEIINYSKYEVELKELLKLLWVAAGEDRVKKQSVGRLESLTFDLLAEARRVHQRLVADRTRASLLPRQRNESDGGARELLIKEKNTVQQTIGQLSITIEEATATVESLSQQRQRLSNASSIATQIRKRFGTVGVALKQIGRTQLRNSGILAGVTGSCLLFVLWWIFG